MTAASGDPGETPQNGGVDPVFPAYGPPPGPAYGPPADPAYGPPADLAYGPPPPYRTPYAGPAPSGYDYGGYGYPGYPGYPVPQQAGTNTLAIIAMISSVLGLLCGFGSVLGIILGAVAIGQVKKSGQRGHGLAVSAIVVGIASLVLSIILWTYARNMN